MSDKIKRLFIDIETSPNVGLFWSPGYRISIGPENIIRERAIICIAWKWSGQKTVHALKWDSNQNDKTMLKKIVKVLDQADEIVAHNGDKFDLAWIRTRCLKHEIPMKPYYVTQDTLKLARYNFKFNSNRLDYITKFLGMDGKHATGYDLWKQILLNKCAKSMRTMVNYCKNDVVILEKIWNKMMPYVPAKTSVAIFISDCPECGSSKTVVNQKRITAAGYKKLTFRCKDCGKYHTVAESRYKKAKAATKRIKSQK